MVNRSDATRFFFTDYDLGISVMNLNDALQATGNKFIKKEKYALDLNNFLRGRSLKIQSQVALARDEYLTTGTKECVEFLIQFAVSF